MITHRTVRRYAAILLAIGLSLTFAQPAAAYWRSSITVISDCTNETVLRAVIATVQPGDSIVFRCSGTIPLTIAGGGTIAITKDLTIDGAGGRVTIDGGGFTSLFSVNPGVNLTLANLSLAHGSAGQGQGGAVLNGGTLIVRGVSFVDDDAKAGGAIYNTGTLAVLGSTFAGNNAFVGSAIYNGGTASLAMSSVSGTNGVGSAVINFGTMTVVGTTFSGNRATGGDAITNGGVLRISASIFVGNTTAATGQVGGALYNQATGTITITASMFLQNSASAGGAVYNDGALHLSGVRFERNSPDDVENGPTGRSV